MRISHGDPFRINRLRGDGTSKSEARDEVHDLKDQLDNNKRVNENLDDSSMEVEGGARGMSKSQARDEVHDLKDQVDNGKRSGGQLTKSSSKGLMVSLCFEGELHQDCYCW